MDNALILTTISTLKQQIQGSSPDDQEEVCRRYAQSREINIVDVIPFTVSRHNESEQILRYVLDYSHKSPVKIKYLIFKCIDRFTRGGIAFYLHLKEELDKNGITCLDTYGVIQQPINTLAHLDVEFPWSKSSPFQNAEIFEAARSEQEVSIILTRMFGAAIQYRRKGYASRLPKIGLQNIQKITSEGKRVVLTNHPTEDKWIIKIFNLRAEGILSDEKIVEEVNDMGYVSRPHYKWDRTGTKPVSMGRIEGKPLDVKQLQKLVLYTDYAGIICDKWTFNKPVKAAYFNGLVSIDTFNKANRGKIVIVKLPNDEYRILKNQKPTIRSHNNPLYPFKECVLCPICNKPTTGSAPKSKNGHIARYHHYHPLNKDNRWWSVNRKIFHKTVYDFVSSVKFDSNLTSLFKEIVLDVWKEKAKETEQVAIDNGKQVQLLREKRQLMKERIITSPNEAVLKVLGEELESIDKQLEKSTEIRNDSEYTDQQISQLLTYAEYFMEHLQELLIVEDKPEQQALLFGLLFDILPNYNDLASGTPKISCIFELNQQSALSKEEYVTPVGVEPTITWMKARCPRPLDDGALNKKTMYYLTTLASFKEFL
jgi:DNA invertase Pin-like site-specific DNA recombinase